MPPPMHDATALFDRRAWRLHRERAARRGSVAIFCTPRVAERLADRLADVGRRFPPVLDLGAARRRAGACAGARPGVERIVAAEPAPRVSAAAAPACGSPPTPSRCRLASACFDLAVSALALHWVDDLPGALIQLRHVLQPDGLLLAALWGGETLAELRTALIEAELAEEGGASPRVSPTADLADAAALLQRAGFALPVADADTIAVTYPDLLALMHDLRAWARPTPSRRAGERPCAAPPWPAPPQSTPNVSALPTAASRRPSKSSI